MMNAPMIHCGSQSPMGRHQRGVALVVCLILLLVMTLAGLSGIRLVTTQERMVGYSYDRTLAFQAAEATLRNIEDRIETVGSPTPAASAACNITGTAPGLMICGAPAATDTPRWLSNTFTNWTDSPTTVTSLVTPEYFVEYLGNTFPCNLTSGAAATCRRYRVTVRANAGGERANVMLQSIYAN